MRPRAQVRTQAGMTMKLPGLRWWIVALLLGAAVPNCVDRQAFSALAATLRHELAMALTVCAVLASLAWRPLEFGGGQRRRPASFPQ